MIAPALGQDGRRGGQHNLADSAPLAVSTIPTAVWAESVTLTNDGATAVRVEWTNAWDPPDAPNESVEYQIVYSVEGKGTWADANAMRVNNVLDRSTRVFIKLEGLEPNSNYKILVRGKATVATWDEWRKVHPDPAPQFIRTSFTGPMVRPETGPTGSPPGVAPDEKSRKRPNRPELPPADEDRSGDSAAPARITDLRVTAVSTTEAELTWAAVGDDGTSGKATRYQIRYNTVPQVFGRPGGKGAPDPPLPGEPGTHERYLLKGLAPGTKYWIGVEVQDDASPKPNVSRGVVATFTTKPRAEVPRSSPGSSVRRPPATNPPKLELKQIRVHKNAVELLVMVINRGDALGPLSGFVVYWKAGAAGDSAKTAFVVAPEAAQAPVRLEKLHPATSYEYYGYVIVGDRVVGRTLNAAVSSRWDWNRWLFLPVVIAAALWLSVRGYREWTTRARARNRPRFPVVDFEVGDGRAEPNLTELLDWTRLLQETTARASQPSVPDEVVWVDPVPPARINVQTVVWAGAHADVSGPTPVPVDRDETACTESAGCTSNPEVFAQEAPAVPLAASDEEDFMLLWKNSGVGAEGLLLAIMNRYWGLPNRKRNMLRRAFASVWFEARFCRL